MCLETLRDGMLFDVVEELVLCLLIFENRRVLPGRLNAGIFCFQPLALAAEGDVVAGIRMINDQHLASLRVF
jgi:hypothetical protein